MADTQRDTSLLQVPGNDNRAKSPFEIGEKTDMQIASSKAIIDKALIMDVSGGITKNIDEYISLFFTDFCALDKASCADISEVKVVVVEEVEEPEVVEEPEPEDPDMVEIEIEVSEEETGDDGVVKRVKRKVMKKVHKDEVPKQEEPPAETPAERKRRERMEKLAAKKGAEGGAEEAVEGEGGESGNESGEGKEDKTEVKPEDTESNVGGGDEDDDDTASVTSETSTKKKTKKKKKKGAAPEPIPEPEPEPEPIEDIPEPKPAPKEPDSDDDLIYPKEVFDNPDVWQKIDSAELLSAEEQARIASARQSVHLMTERERDLEWQRQRTLLRPPLIVSHLKARAAPVGGTAKLTCTVTGPELTVKWLKDGNPIEKSFEKYRFQVTETLLSLEILKLDIHDVGEYQCEIKNKNGACDTKATVKVYEPFEIKPIPPTFVSLKETDTVPQEKPAEPQAPEGEKKDEPAAPVEPKTSDAEATPAAAAKPPTIPSTVPTTPATAAVGQPIAASSAPAETASTSEAGEAPKPEEKKKIPKWRQKEEEVKRVSYFEEQKKLRFNVRLINQTVIAGADVRFVCAAAGGRKKIELEWVRNGEPILFGLKYKDLTDEASDKAFGSILVTKVDQDDNGEYTCIARSEKLEVTTTAVLTVLPKPDLPELKVAPIYDKKIRVKDDAAPIFIIPINDHYSPQTNELVIDCVVRGRPKPTIKWFRNMAPLGFFPDDRMTVYHHHDENLETITTSVTIYAPNYGDKGKYECVIENELGSNRLIHNVCYGTEEEFFRIINNREKQKEIEKAMELRKQKKLEEDAKKAAEAAKAAEEKAKAEAEAKAQAEKAAKAAARAAAKAALKAGSALPVKNDMELAHEAVELRKKFDFVGRARNRQIPMNTSFHLSCVVKCPEEFETEWYKNDIKLANGIRLSHTTTLEGGCYLQIERARLTDTGRYKCVVISKTLGEISCECELEVYQIKSGDLEPTYTKHLNETKLPIKNEILLDCHVRGEPRPTIRWLHNGVYIKKNEKYYMTYDEEGRVCLHINFPERFDTGSYTCRANNSVGQTDSSIHIDVKNAVEDLVPQYEEELAKSKRVEKYSKYVDDELIGYYDKYEYTSKRRNQKIYDYKYRLKFVTKLSDQRLHEGSDLKFTCYVDGKFPTFTWFKDEIPLIHSRKYRQKIRRDGKVTLNVINIGPDDAGIYKIVAQNYAGEIESTSKVTIFDNPYVVFVPPTFTNNILEQYSINSDELVLECRVRGTPRPHIAWMKDGDYIIPGDKHEQYETAEGTCKLVICTPEESDCGTYTCEAECGGVSDTISHNVHFEGANAYILQKVHGFYHRSTIKPHFIIGLTDNSICSGGSIILNVEAPPSCEAKWYRDKKLLVQKLPKTRMFAENGFFGLCIQGSTMDESGAYTCRIENSFGINETTSHVDIINPNAVKGLKPPIFFARPQPEIRIRCGDPLSMSFRVNGDPKPKIMWMKGCRDITNSNRTIKEAHSDYIRFSFKDTTQADEGTYFIVARNKLGVDRAFCHVSIKPPRTKPDSITTNDDSNRSDRTRK